MDERIARSRISRKKAQGFGFDEPKPAKTKSIDRQEFEEIHDAYENELSQSNRLDYDDLLLRCQQLLKEFPACVSNVEAVLIDEFQDTNTVQYELMKLFASCQQRITIVGDPDQSIYGFRSAEIKNLTRMKAHYPETTTIILEENYRSCGAILRVAQNVIEQDTARPSKSLQATHAYGTLPVLRKLPSAAAEAAWIVAEIQRAIALTGNLLKQSDFAILLRSAHLSRQIESAMGKAGIPYQMVGGCRFYDRLEIRILLDYLKVIYQPGNNEALLAIMNVPARKIGDKSREVLLAEAKEKGCSLFDFVHQITRGTKSSTARLTKLAEQNLGSLVSLILSGQQTLKCLTPAADAPKILLDFLVKTLSFKKYLEDTHSEDFDSRWANIEELHSQAEDISLYANDQRSSEALPSIDGIEQQDEHGAESVLSQFLANISLSSQADALTDDATYHKVTISTIHAAKGLEWPVVFVPALYDGSIPHSRAEDTDEERRLLYVAMTRAQALLYLSQPLRQSGARGSEETELSSFVAQRSADKFFQATGSTFSDELVRTIAKTLRRQVPSAESVVRAMETLRSTEDNLWPASGEKGELDRALYEDLSIGSLKRKFEDDNPANMRSLLAAPGNLAGMQRSLSTGNSTVSFDITTAADHLRTHPPPTLAPTKTFAAAYGVTFTAPIPPKRSKIPPNQPFISSFFGRKQPPADSKTNIKPPPLEIEAGEPSLPSLPLNSSISTSITISQSQRQPTSGPYHLLPSGLSSHRLPSPTSLQNKSHPRPKPLVESNANAKAYEFLSSSPTREEGFDVSAVKNAGSGAGDGNGNGNENENENGRGDRDVGKEVAAVEMSRPAKTFHSTTMSTSTSTSIEQLQNQTKPGLSLGSGIKRRYGYGTGGGRGMASWADRKNK